MPAQLGGVERESRQRETKMPIHTCLPVHAKPQNLSLSSKPHLVHTEAADLPDCGRVVTPLPEPNPASQHPGCPQPCFGGLVGWPCAL